MDQDDKAASTPETDSGPRRRPDPQLLRGFRRGKAFSTPGSQLGANGRPPHRMQSNLAATPAAERPSRGAPSHRGRVDSERQAHPVPPGSQLPSLPTHRRPRSRRRRGRTPASQTLWRLPGCPSLPRTYRRDGALPERRRRWAQPRVGVSPCGSGRSAGVPWPSPSHRMVHTVKPASGPV